MKSGRNIWGVLIFSGALALSACGGGSGSTPNASPAAANETVQGATTTQTSYTFNNQVSGNTSSGTTTTTTATTTNTSTPAVSQPAPSGPRFAVSMEDMPAVGPFSSWANVKTQYGAKGDGVTDDTTAIQNALNDIGQSGKAYVLFLPAGTYRITHTLTFTPKDYYQGVQIIGQEKTGVTILWNGPTGGTMLRTNGGVNTRFSRITWNGNKTAGYGVVHWWIKTGTDASGNPIAGYVPYYGMSYEHSDEIFEDMGIGIMAGRLGYAYNMLDSEGQIRRVTFLRNTQAGFDTGSWNALDWWIWDSHFIDCARGVTNLFSFDDTGATYGAGGFHVYRSLFERSTVADLDIHNTQWYAIHDSVSVGSRRFVEADQIGYNSASIILQGNRVLDTTDPVSIYIGNLGPLILLDNQIRSLGSVTGPVVQMDDVMADSGRDVLSMGNSFTVANPISGRDTSDRIVRIGDKTVARTDISSTLPTLSPTPAWLASQAVFNVPAGASTPGIQAVIDKAAASGAANPIVHFPPGKYILSGTLVVPAKTTIQLVGDGLGSVLQWRTDLPGGLMIKLEGPSYATVRDMQLVDMRSQGIAVTNADQPGGRVLVVGSTLGPVNATGLQNTELELQASPMIKTLTLSNVASMNLIGSGGLGPVKIDASNAFISDTWYEGVDSDLYRITSGNVTYLGGSMMPSDPSHGTPVAPSDPAILLDGFNGTATFVGFKLGTEGISTGIGIQIGAETANTKALFMGVSSRPNFYSRTSSGGSVGLYMSKNRDTTTGRIVSVADQGSSDTAFVTNAFQQARSLAWDSAPYTPPAGATNVRLYRIRTLQMGQGLAVTAN